MKKLAALILALCLMLSMCVSASAVLPPELVITATPETYANTNLKKDYTVNMYLIGDKPNDWPRVEALINDYLEPFNTKLATTFMSWSDYQTMYSLVLSGGEQVDLIFTAPRIPKAASISALMAAIRSFCFFSAQMESSV